MSASLAFRVASVVAVLQWAAHTTMFVRATPKHGAEEVAVVHAMQSHRFDFAGASRSYLAKHEGLATLLPGGDLMFRRYASFRQQLPAACTDAGLSLKEVEFTTYCRLLDQWLRKNSDWKPWVIPA